MGFGLLPECNSYLDPVFSLECKPCLSGETYSPSSDYNPCLPCAICSTHEKVIKNCTVFSNSNCSRSCSKGFYFNDVTGDCQPCSWCCHDDSDNVIEECKNSGMPVYKSCGVEQSLSCRPKCKTDQYILVNNLSGEVSCRDCPVCPLGTGLARECGSIVDDSNLIKCKECETGKMFSDERAATQCKKCSTCSAKVVTKQCTNDSDSKCGECLHGYYKDNSTMRCAQCSYCCGDDSDTRLQECIQQGMSSTQQCLLTQRSATVCQHIQYSRKNGLNKLLLDIFVSVIALATLLTIAVAVIKRRRQSRSKAYRRIKNHSSPKSVENCTATASVAHQSTDVEWALAHGSTETIFFRKSGVLVEFADSESYSDLSTNLAVEVDWNELNYPPLNKNEVLLSPVIRFHPRNMTSKSLLNVRIPHSAFLEGSHSLKLRLVRSTDSWENVASHIRVEENEVCFSTCSLHAYAVVGTGDILKKRMQCAVFAGNEIKNKHFTANLCMIDDCEASQERIMREQASKGRVLLGSLRAIFIDVADSKAVNVHVEMISEGWVTANIEPNGISCVSCLDSYKKIPKSKITFHQQDQTKQDFQCSIVVENGKEKVTIPIFSYFPEKSGRKKRGRNILQSQESFSVEENLTEEQQETSNTNSVLRVSDLSPDTFRKIRKLLSSRREQPNSDLSRGSVNLGVENGMEGTADWSAETHCGKTNDYFTVTDTDMTVEEFATQLKKIHRPDVVQLLKPYLQKAAVV